MQVDALLLRAVQTGHGALKLILQTGENAQIALLLFGELAHVLQLEIAEQVFLLIQLVLFRHELFMKKFGGVA